MIQPYADPQLMDFRNFLYQEFVGDRLGLPTKCQYDMANVFQNLVKPVLGLPWDESFKEDYPMLWDDDRRVKDEIDWDDLGSFDPNDEGVVIPGPYRKAQIQAFRGIGKSLLAELLACWSFPIKPDINIFVCSADAVRAGDFTSYTYHKVLNTPELMHLAPGTAERSSTLRYELAGMAGAHAPSMAAKGVMTSMTGGRADIIIADDVEVPNTSDTLTMREKLELRIKEFTAILKPNGCVIYLGTPQCEDSTYVKLERKGVPRIIWPARYPNDSWMEGNGHALAPLILKEMTEDPSIRTGYGMDGKQGKATDPHRFPEFELLSKEAEGRSYFQLQFMLDATLSDVGRYPLKCHDLVVMNLDDEEAPEIIKWSNTGSCALTELPCMGLQGDGFFSEYEVEGNQVLYQNCIMAIDPAGMGGDEMGYAIIKQLNGYLFVMECKGLRGGYVDKNLRLLVARAKHFGVNKIVCEENMGAGMFTKLLHPHLEGVYACEVEDIHNHIQKERRIIDVLEPLLNQHRIIMNRQVILDDLKEIPDIDVDKQNEWKLFHQLTRITYEPKCLKHDDRLDALAICAQACVDMVAQSAVKKRRERDLKEFYKQQQEMVDFTNGGGQFLRKKLDLPIKGRAAEMAKKKREYKPLHSRGKTKFKINNKFKRK